MKKLNKILIFMILPIVTITLILIIQRALFYRETDARCTFTQDDIESLVVFNTHNYLLGDYEISNDDVIKISNNLVTSNKIRISPSDWQIAEDGIAIMIRLYDGRTIWLYSKDDNSIHLILHKIGGYDQMLTLQSSWLASYLKGIKHEFAS